MVLFFESTLRFVVLLKILTGVTSAAFVESGGNIARDVEATDDQPIDGNDGYGTIEIEFTDSDDNNEVPSTFSSYGLNNLGNSFKLEGGLNKDKGLDFSNFLQLFSKPKLFNSDSYGSKPFTDFSNYFKLAHIFQLIQGLNNLGHLNFNNLGFGTATPTPFTQLFDRIRPNGFNNLGMPRLDNFFSRINPFSFLNRNYLSNFYDIPNYDRFNGFNLGFGSDSSLIPKLSKIRKLLKLATSLQNKNVGNTFELGQNFDPLNNIFGTNFNWGNPAGSVQIPKKFDISNWPTANFDFTKIFTPGGKSDLSLGNIFQNGGHFPEIKKILDTFKNKILQIDIDAQDPDIIKKPPQNGINPPGNGPVPENIVSTELPTLSVDSPEFKNIVKDVPEIGLKYPGTDTLKDIPYIDLIKLLIDIFIKAVDDIQGGKIFINLKLLENVVQDLKNLQDNKLNPEGIAKVVQNLVDLIKEVKSAVKNDKDGVAEVDTKQKQFRDAINDIKSIRDGLKTLPTNVPALQSSPVDILAFTADVQSILDAIGDPDFKSPGVSFDKAQLKSVLTDILAVINDGKDSQGTDLPKLANVVRGLLDIFASFLNCEQPSDEVLSLNLDPSELQKIFEDLKNAFEKATSAQDSQFQNSPVVELVWNLVRVLKGVLIPGQGAAKNDISKASLGNLCLVLKSAQGIVNALNLIDGLPKDQAGALVKEAADVIKTPAGVASNVFSK